MTIGGQRITGLSEAVNDAMRAGEDVAGIACRGVVCKGEGFVALHLGGEEALRLTLHEAEALALALMDSADAAAVLAGLAGALPGEAP